MLNIKEQTVLFSDDDGSPACVPGWYDCGDKPQQIANKEREIAEQQEIVDEIQKICNNLSGFEDGIESLTGDYAKMTNKFVEVGQFGVENGDIDADHLFSGSAECLKSAKDPLVELKAQAAEDWEIEDERLTNLKTERNDPHFGMYEVKC